MHAVMAVEERKRWEAIALGAQERAREWGRGVNLRPLKTDANEPGEGRTDGSSKGLTSTPVLLWVCWLARGDSPVLMHARTLY